MDDPSVAVLNRKCESTHWLTSWLSPNENLKYNPQNLTDLRMYGVEYQLRLGDLNILMNATVGAGRAKAWGGEWVGGWAWNERWSAVECRVQGRLRLLIRSH